MLPVNLIVPWSYPLNFFAKIHISPQFPTLSSFFFHLAVNLYCLQPLRAFISCSAKSLQTGGYQHIISYPIAVLKTEFSLSENGGEEIGERREKTNLALRCGPPCRVIGKRKQGCRKKKAGFMQKPCRVPAAQTYSSVRSLSGEKTHCAVCSSSSGVMASSCAKSCSRESVVP